MKWRGREGSDNIEDRRGQGGISRGGRIGGIGLLIILALGYFLGVDVTPFINQDTLGGGETEVRELTEEDQQAAEFVSVVLKDTESVWTEVFQTQLQAQYRAPQIVLFSQGTQSPCGDASGATGPFYCPVDQKAYLDTEFFNQLSQQFGAGGDFAAAYVVAHEIAHHVQNMLGTLEQATAVRQRSSVEDSNRISVMIELQADCYSGVWARYAEERLGTLDEGDVAEAMNAAQQIGDDTLQRAAGQRPMPHTFTHGTSEQRQEWFARGYQSAKLDQCDTFGSGEL
jgi:uncharacterized protein